MINGAQTTNHELEAKFTLVDAARVEYWCTAPTLTAAFVLESPTTVTHLDTYLDAADYRLLRHGYTLRLRRTATGYLVTVKSLSLDVTAAVHNRLELEGPTVVEADPWQMANWPEPIRQLVGALIGSEVELQPLCTLQQIRHKRNVFASNANAQPVAELSIDQIVVYGPTLTSADAAEFLTQNLEEHKPDQLVVVKPIATFEELELELKPGQDQALLTRLARGLTKDRTLRANTNSKLERALASISTHVFDGENDAPAMQPKMHIAEACRLLWRQQLTEMLLKEAGVRYSNHMAYIHEMRVAIRRARVAARLFGKYFQPKRIRRFMKFLKQTGQRLGAVRDLDVALNRLAAFETNKSTHTPDNGEQSPSDPAELAALATYWRAERIRAHQELLAWLDSTAYAQFIENFARFCQTTGKGAKKFAAAPGKAPKPYQVRHVMPGLLFDRFKRVRSFETLFEIKEPIPEATLHALRIEFKYMRYSLEFMRLFPGFHGEQLIKSLKQLQEHLGQLNDAVVSRTLLTSLPAMIETTATDHYANTQTTKIEQLRDSLAADLERFWALANRRKLTQAIARI